MSARYTVTYSASVSAIIGAGTPDATSSTRIRPNTMKGWRPISVTYQPATVATQPEKVMPARPHSSGRGSCCAAQPRRRYSHRPAQLNSSISSPTPTIRRKP
jgi:hypothetical protein